MTDDHATRSHQRPERHRRRRLPGRGALLSVRVPALGVAAPLLYRRPPRPARPVRPRARARVRGVAPDTTRNMEPPGPGHRVERDALPLSSGPDGPDEHGLARHAGHVSHLSRARLAPRAHDTGRRDGLLAS